MKSIFRVPSLRMRCDASYQLFVGLFERMVIPDPACLPVITRP